MRVLIIDDEPEVLQELKELIGSAKGPDGRSFEAAGVPRIIGRPLIASSRQEEQFDAVITDMVMGKEEDEGIQILRGIANRTL